LDAVSTATSTRTGVTAAGGFRAAGLAAGIKGDGALDLALLAADRPVPVAAVFTTSLAAAPPVELDRHRVASGVARAVIVNSGCANAATGRAGLEDAVTMTAGVAAALGCADDDVLVCSTGVIGSRLPLDRITAAIPALVAGMGADAGAGLAAATAIMTTDSVPKQAVAHGDGWVVGGMAKGAGMLRPDMATMLAFLTTDAVVGSSTLAGALGEAVATTFNCLDVDGCQSTNDSTILMASGDSGITPDPAGFAAAVRQVCAALTRQLAADAEGASKVVTIEVRGAADDAAARRLGKAVADSALVRAAFHGADPNWGRVLGALGVAGVPLDQTRVDIGFAGHQVCRGGVASGFDDRVVSAAIAGDFTMSIGVGEGPGLATIVTTDLTPDYVRFNSDRS
jgi:glutamate N-acetyltransferase/amino-acid N-acetyltransferase